MTSLRLLIALLLVSLHASGANAATPPPPSAECAYLHRYLGYSLSPSLLPSVRTTCIEALNSLPSSGNVTAICTLDCRSLYDVYAQCAPERADSVATNYCGRFRDSPCSVLTSSDYDLVLRVYSSCSRGSDKGGGNSTYCSPSCASSIAALEEFSGCCRYDDLNGPKALCGQRPLAPCSTVLNDQRIPSLAPSSRECAYYSSYSDVEVASFTPSIDPACRAAKVNYPTSGRNPCFVPECQSLYDMVARCQGLNAAATLASDDCGSHGNQTCASLLSNASMIPFLYKSCANSTHCSPTCLEAISVLERYGGCCFGDQLNGPKALCGQLPLSHCPTNFNIVNSPSIASTVSSASPSDTFPGNGASLGTKVLLTVLLTAVVNSMRDLDGSTTVDD